MDRQSHYRQLSALLEAEWNGSAALLACLEQERTALAGRDSALLESSTAAKQARLQELEQLASQRATLAEGAGFNRDKPGMQAYMEWSDPAGALATRWQELLELLGKCQRQNRVNGGAIELSRDQVTTALRILRGQNASGGNSATYQADGRSGNSLDARSLGSA